MRVVIVTGIYPPDIGGPATHSADLGQELLARGHRAKIVTLWDGPSVRRSSLVTRYPRRWPWWLRLGAVALWLRRHRSDYDVVYATGLHPGAALGAKLAGRPLVAKVPGDPAWERAIRLGLTRSDFPTFQTAPNAPRVRAMRWVRDRSLRAADAVITPSRSLAEIVETWLEGSKRVRVIPNGVRVTESEKEQDSVGGRGPQLAENALHAIYAGRLIPEKRVDVLLKAISGTEGVVLDILGDGPHRRDLERTARTLGLGDRVRFLGVRSHPEVLERLRNSDVLVLASSYENLPHVAIEALACGRPILAPAVGGMAEVVKDGESGLLLTSASPQAYSEALSRLRDDPSLRRHLRLKAQEAGSYWRFDRCANDLLELFAGLVEKSKPAAVFFGKGGFPAHMPAGLTAKFEILSRWLAPTIVTTAPRRHSHVAGARLIGLPAGRNPAGSILFYALGSVVALLFSLPKQRSVVVCQSPFEGFLVLSLRRLLPERFRPGVVVEVHGDWRSATRLYGSSLRIALAPIADALAAKGVRGADLVRTVSRSHHEMIRRTGYGGKIETFGAFTDLDLFLATPPEPVPTRPAVAYVGSLERVKGVDVLIEAWPTVLAKVPQATLTIAGAGRLASVLRRRIASIRGDSVELKGPIPISDVKTLLDESSLLILPSRSEGLPRVVLEAFARGRPVISTRIGGVEELVVEGKTGALVSPDDPVELASAVIELLQAPATIQIMGEQARLYAESRDLAAEFENGIRGLAAWADERV